MGQDTSAKYDSMIWLSTSGCTSSRVETFKLVHPKVIHFAWNFVRIAIPLSLSTLFFTKTFIVYHDLARLSVPKIFFLQEFRAILADTPKFRAKKMDNRKSDQI